MMVLRWTSGSWLSEPVPPAPRLVEKLTYFHHGLLLPSGGVCTLLTTFMHVVLSLNWFLSETSQTDGFAAVVSVRKC